MIHRNPENQALDDQVLGFRVGGYERRAGYLRRGTLTAGEFSRSSASDCQTKVNPFRQISAHIHKIV